MTDEGDSDAGINEGDVFSGDCFLYSGNNADVSSR